MRAISQIFLVLPTAANIRRLRSIAVALCIEITICLTGIATAATVTYSWTGTIIDFEVDDETGIYTGTLTDGVTELHATEVALSITNDDPVLDPSIDPGGQAFVSKIFGKDDSNGGQHYES